MQKQHNYLRGGLTPKQREYFDFIRDYIHENGYSPTRDTIAKRFNVSVANAQNKVDALVKKGFLERDANANNGLRLPCQS